MRNNSPKKLEIFLWLALRQLSRRGITAEKESETTDSVETERTSSSLMEISGLFEQLNKTEADKFKSLLADYNNKSDAEKEIWKKQIRSFVGTDETFLDENIHWSHIEEVLQKESPAIRRIVFNSLSESDKDHLKSPLNIREEIQTIENGRKSKFRLIEKNIRQSFAKQFTALHDLQKPTAFDRLNGTQTVRLIRLVGIREVTFACARIKAVETVAAFLKRFSAEDARAIVTQLNNLPKTSSERLLFAENLVQIALETESQPSAMLDLLGIRLIGIRVCESPANRISYTQQKLPREFAPELSEIIETQCRQTPANLQTEIASEIEQLAETIIKTSKLPKNKKE